MRIRTILSNKAVALHIEMGTACLSLPLTYAHNLLTGIDRKKERVRESNLFACIRCVQQNCFNIGFHAGENAARFHSVRWVSSSIFTRISSRASDIKNCYNIPLIFFVAYVPHDDAIWDLLLVKQKPFSVD